MLLRKDDSDLLCLQPHESASFRSLRFHDQSGTSCQHENRKFLRGHNLCKQLQDLKSSLGKRVLYQISAPKGPDDRLKHFLLGKPANTY